MTHAAPTLASPTALWIAVAVTLITAAVAAYRRPALPVATYFLIWAGLVLLCLAAGGLRWQRPAAREVAVMVDLSPSTRTAGFRDRAVLDARIRQLLGATPYRLLPFADGTRAADLTGPTLADLPADQTRFAPPPTAAAVLLFSDGRFEPPGDAGPPTYAVIDAALDNPTDAAVTNLTMRGPTATVTVRNATIPRNLMLSGVSGPSPTTVPTGASVLDRPADSQAATVGAQLAPGDPWPENDGLTTIRPPPPVAERWLVTNGRETPPPPGWRIFAPRALPTDAAAYLAAAVVVLDNVAADEVSPLQQDRLRQYVRDLGGGMLILGGDRAFAAGAYAGTTLDALSPLASHPPAPTAHWMLLVDGSGSMGSVATGGDGGASETRWQHAAAAVARLVPQLPPEDVVTAGHFAERVNWWVTAKPARDVAALPLPPAGIAPRGPTNLRAALEAAATLADGALPTHLLLASDTDAAVGDPASLTEAFRRKKVRLHLLALGDGQGLAALEQIAAATGGRSQQQLDPAKWAKAVQDLMRLASPNLFDTTAIEARFIGELSGVPGRTVAPWNRVWLKRDAAAMSEARGGDERIVLAGRWNLGAGQVAAVAFGPLPGELDRLVEAVARPPHDPRYRVTWDASARLRVTVDAAEGSAYLNGETITLELSEGATPAQSHAVPQTGPGQYELSLPAPRSPTLATLWVGGRPIDRTAVGGRYAPEFDAAGNDRAALRDLAERSGGKLVDPQMTSPIEFKWPSRDVALTPHLAMGGAAFIALGLLWWRAR